MTDYTSIAAHDLRLFIWDQLKNAGILNAQDYYVDGFDTPLIPIIPTQQIPEFNNNLPGVPYIIYEYEVMPIPEQWWMSHEILQLMIVANDYDKINTIMNFLLDLFRRYDESAKDVYVANILSNNFDFKYTAIQRITSPSPFKTEGGLMVGNIDILYSYVRKITSSGRF